MLIGLSIQPADNGWVVTVSETGEEREARGEELNDYLEAKQPNSPASIMSIISQAPPRQFFLVAKTEEELGEIITKHVFGKEK